ncbi:Uncharacterized protein DBV15_10396 [Temnothorax longispinosus]|uniref:Uncharacterized protein n=1 Tax=Temnothorax longispinosus TaxID=300112 RepID=A0A4S2L9U5_9HYME|nr:Uncharacterized protein DBV15_10396 [Temnothorax longispinosus]
MYILAPDFSEFSTAEEVRRPIPGTCSTLPLVPFFSDQAGERRARREISLSYSRASRLLEKKGVTSLFSSLTVGFAPKRPCPPFFFAGFSFGPLVNVPFGKEPEIQANPYRTQGCTREHFPVSHPLAGARHDWRPLEHSGGSLKSFVDSIRGDTVLKLLSPLYEIGGESSSYNSISCASRSFPRSSNRPVGRRRTRIVRKLLFDANVSASWQAKTVTGYPQPLENGCPMAEMFIPRTREIWNAATCSTYVNCSAKQAVSGSSPAHISQRTVAIYTQITLHDLEQARILYFTLPRLTLQ